MRKGERPLCAMVYNTKQVKGRLPYPRAARTGPYAFAQKVGQMNAKVVTRYVGITKVPENSVIEKG